MEDKKSAFEEFPILETERFILRAIGEEDAYDLFLVFVDKDAMKFSGIGSVTTVEQVKRIVRKLNSFYNNKTAIRWGIEDKKSKRIIGDCGFFSYNEYDKRVEIGYVLKRKYWNRGIMSEVLSAVLNYGFENLDLNRVSATVDEDNKRSLRLLKKLNFKVEGTLREYNFHPEDNKFNNVVILGLLKNEL